MQMPWIGRYYFDILHFYSPFISEAWKELKLYTSFHLFTRLNRNGLEPKSS